MKKQWVRKILIPGVVVVAGSLVFTGICFFLYLGIVLSLESMLVGSNSQAFPMDTVRIGSTIVLAVVYLILSFTKLPELVKAIWLTGTIGAIGVTIILSLYQTPWVAVLIFLALVGGLVILFVHNKKPWFFFLSLILASVIAVVYAWPTT
ncbi:MAG: hypothetical protein PHP61_06725 [Candidatus Izemoplasmatales bacterium]|nr:hypothetical protein [Candidatus Izemoplasmatales bacterium]NLF48111.1 hypothetical protein [Acholeplasmataceae bacterium]MDD4355575.1 hypothetical protein [Candidatus Izemoplasmatales bacterium]MDD4988532.1 hypothetical protein [Candidatus Izemoplasmatales bacterium]MDD5601860.1 hypothetical protein [Candidatus Izemoplasmatales bacterium]